MLGFTSIYREGFETVLFLQSLVLEAGIGVGAARRGAGVGRRRCWSGVVTFALQAQLPYKKMLVVTGVLIGVVLLTMVGNTVHVMQVVGWMPITPITGLQLPYWIGSGSACSPHGRGSAADRRGGLRDRQLLLGGISEQAPP